MFRNYIIYFTFFSFITNTYSQTLAPGCGAALPFCAGTSTEGISFPNTTGVPSVGSYSCLTTQPNAFWYYLQISQGGTLNFRISQITTTGEPIDVDFIAWGPFTTAPTCGTTNLNINTQVGCSYSTASTEIFTINNAVVGQYYMVLMTNFRNLPGTISLAQTGGTGATSCDIVCPLTLAGGGVSDCRDNILTANYLNSAQVGTTFNWTFNSANTAATSGPNFVALPRSNNSTLNTLATGAGDYCVTARSTGCSTTQSAVCTTITRGVPVPYNPPNTLFACNNSTFNLTQNTNVLLQGLPGLPSNYRVRYNVNPTNAITNISPISTTSQTAFSGIEGQIIYATVMDQSLTYCYAVAQFVLRFQFCAFATSNTGPICAGSTFNLSATDPGIGTVTYAWTGPNGFVATGPNVSNVPTPTGIPPFNYICTATPTAVGGAPLTSTTTVVVNAIPVATATQVLNPICSGGTTDIALGSTVSGTTFEWTANSSNTSGFSAGAGINIAQTLSATGTTVGTVNYRITPTANSCVGTPINTIISVNPIPVVTATPTPGTICSGTTSNIVLTSTPPGATFAWTAIQTDVSGATPGSGTSIAQILTAPGNLTGTVDYTVTPTLNTCVGLPIRTTINVNPIPVVVATPLSTTICSGNSPSIALTSLVSGATFAWTVVQNNVSGASSGNGSNIAQVLTATNTSSGTAIYSITPSANGCVGSTKQVTINVILSPTATISYSGTPFCSSLTSQAVALTGTNAFTGGVYSSTIGLTIDSATGTVTPNTSTAGSYVVTYTTPSSAGCAAVSVTTNITITALPTATISYAGTPFCFTQSTGQAVTLLGTSAYTGGTYSSTSGLTIDATSGTIIPSTSSTGSYVVTYLVQPSSGCQSVSATTTILINNLATAIINYSGTPYCSGVTSANAILTGTSGGTFTGTFGLIINAATGTVDLTSPPGLYTVSYTVAASGGCNALIVTTQITINATTIPVTNFSYISPICKNGSNPRVIPVSGFTTGGNFTTSSAGLSIDNLTGEINLASSLAGSYTVSYTVPATTCGPVGTNATIIVITDVPTATISYSGTPFCTSLTSSQTVALTGTNAFTGGVYSSIVGLTIDSVTGAVTPNTSTAGSYVVTYTIPSSAGCATVLVTTNITITALPTATISYSGTAFCTTLIASQAVTLNGTNSFTGGVYSSTAGLTINPTTGAVMPSTSSPSSYIVTYTISAGAGCSQVTATTNIIINPVPIATATPNTVTICSLDLTNINLTSNAIGTTYDWTVFQNNVSGAATGSGTTIAQVLTVTTATPGTAIYTITPSGSGCTGLPIIATVTVNPLPSVTISGNTTICFGTSSTVNFLGTANASVIYSVNGGINQNVTLNNLGVASVPTGNLTTTTTYELVKVVATGAPTCSQLQSGSITVIVVPIPQVNATVTSSVLCSGQPTGISLSSNIPSATFNWTVTQLGASGASAGNGDIISQNLTATGITSGLVTYSIAANTGACIGPVTPILINVNPIPVVTTSAVLQSVCSGSVTPILLTSNVLGTVFNWNVVQTNVTGASSGTGNVIAQTLTTTNNNIGEAVYSITPLVGGCPGIPKIVVVSVNPIPVATANVAVTTICSTNATDITLTSTEAGTTFSWTVIQTGIFGATSGSGTSIVQTLTTVGSNQGTVRYTITPKLNGCSGAPISVIITVNPTPEVFGSSSSVICSGESPNISLFPSIVATTFAWTVNTTNVIGAQSGTGTIINDILIAASNLGTAVYTVTPTASGCSGAPLQITVTVNPAPAPIINDGIICVNKTTNIAFQTYMLDTQLSNASYDFVWYFNGIIINGAVNATYEADESGTYSVRATNTATGCISVLTNAVITDSFPGLTIDTTQTLAFSDNSTVEVTVTPPNTMYLYSLDNGPTQTTNVFTNVEPGNHIVTVTDENGCTYLSRTLTIIGYPTYFTPNGDGFHDTWNILGLGASAKVFIFDRYGKLIKQINPSGVGWDGTYNGEPLIATDYWFTVDYTEDYPTVGTNKVFKAHFSLKR